jgi:hypothetical protein
LWLDVEHFERAVAEGRLEEAVETYAGELLEGCYDEWLVDERERLAALHLEALERLARRHQQGRRWPEAIRCAERLVAHDPLREESRELGIEPSRETRAVYESLLAAAPAGAESPETAPAPSAPRAKAVATSPFVGRAREQARLMAVWRAAAAGRAQLVLVSGEAGVGKTRLVEELRAHAGAVTVEARAYPAEGPLAYGVAAAWLRSQPVAARLSRRDRRYLTELARLLP